MDEFGREILPGRGRRGDDYGGGPVDDPSYLNEALPTSRYPGEGGIPPVGAGHPPPPAPYHRSHHAPQHGRHSHHTWSDQRSSRKRKHRDDSPGGGRRGGKPSSSHHQPHPCTLYAEEPMLCQFLWKESKKSTSNGKDGDGDGGHNEDAAVASDDDNASDSAYDEYRKGYCLNYIRTFFNQHMDDSWFRSLYSPLEEQRVTIQERQRALQEAQAFGAELEASLAKNASDKSPCFFVLKARLGGGIKQSSAMSLPEYNNGTGGSPNRSSSMHSALSNPVPGTHVLAMSQKVLPIQEVPPHVTDEQLLLALLAHVKDLKSSDVKLFSSSIAGNGNLFRTAYIYCHQDEIRKEIIQQLNHMDRAAPPAADGSGGPAGHHVPRKEETFIPKTLPLEVECSDAYGRTEIDADGKGGGKGEEGSVPPRKATVWVSTLVTPASQLTPNVAVLSAAVSSKVHIPKDMKAARILAKAYDIRRNIPPESRLETLLIKAIPLLENPETATEQDVEDALDLAIAYLRRIHLFSFYNGCACANRVADVLSGNHAASTIHLRLGIADEILKQNDADKAAAGEAADAAAHTTTTSTPAATDEPPKVDLLVQRHDLSIEKALEQAQVWLDDPDKWSKVIVDPTKDQQVESISQQERQVEPVWIQDHALVDEDGRARCSFHFCRKLFKDSTFLKKHLLKKHAEFLKAERAKCHDESMMEAWDAQEQRPVPPVLVDCGRSFSLVPSPVLGAAVPLAEDPEPELWRREEERREQEERIREERQERFHPPPHAQPDLDGPLSGGRSSSHHGATTTPRNANFVDVDDMKEEKIELAFDNIEIPMEPPKKKKKKKKLL